MRWLVEALLHVDLRRAFRRVCWVGDWPPDLPERPVIAYANHHHFYDGHLAWLLFRKRLDRSPTLWMAEWDRYPFFAAVGAQPFPPDAPERRAATLRRTARRFRTLDAPVLVYYPEGTLHSPDEGLRPFDAAALERLGDLYSEALWWPYAVHVTWWDEPAPTALLAGGAAHHAPGDARSRLQRLRQRLKEPDYSSVHPLLRGSPSFEERWSFSFAASFFERYL